MSAFDPQQPAYSRFKVGDRVSPDDRNNVGTVVGVQDGDIYIVRFVSRDGIEATKYFHDSELELTKSSKTRGVSDLDARIIPQWVPFPIEKLPKNLRDFCCSAAKASGVDPAFIALPMLSVLAGSIGNKRAIEIKKGWTEPSILWTAVIARPGSNKTGSNKQATGPLWAIQREMSDGYTEEYRKYKENCAKAKSNKEPIESIAPPKKRHIIVDDTTTEALGVILSENRNGVICTPDELKKWISSHDKYRSGKSGSDRSFWLSVHDAQPVKIDRKTPNQESIFVPRAAVSLCGGVQLSVWRDEVSTIDAEEDGMAARLLHAMPPDDVLGWNDYTIDTDIMRSYEDTVLTLNSLKDIFFEPIFLSLADDAIRHFMDLANRVSSASELAEDWERAILGKVKKHAARIALVLQLAHNPSSKVVAAEWMEAGVDIAMWFYNEACRVRSTLSLDASVAEIRSLANKFEILARHKEGKIAARDLISRNRNRFPNTETANSILDNIVRYAPEKWRWVRQEPSSVGGRPSEYIELIQSDTPYFSQ